MHQREHERKALLRRTNDSLKRPFLLIQQADEAAVQRAAVLLRHVRGIHALLDRDELDAHGLGEGPVDLPERGRQGSVRQAQV